MVDSLKHNVAITANRALLPGDHDIIFNTMAELVANPEVEAIYFGGAIGGDTVALQACLDIIVMNKPRLIVVVPDQLSSQPKATQAISRRADEVLELGLPITATDGYRSYHNRNEYMVDHAKRVVAFWNRIQSGGTYACIRYALKNKKHVDYVTIGDR